MLWGLDPIFSAFARLFVRDILQMTESTQPVQPPCHCVTLCILCSHDADHGGFDPVAELKKLRQAQLKRCCLEIGELVRVRGPVKTSRQQREIMASTYYKVDDPVMAIQIAWMMEVPQLYRQFYDKRFQINAAGYRDPSLSADQNTLRTLEAFRLHRQWENVRL
ncbi:hypothetical protein GOODEAATRI_011230, partial [Goodea atripinnis]